MTDVPIHAVAYPKTVPTRAIVCFLLVAFGITWGLIGVYVLAPQWASARFGEISGSHPLFFLATWAPAISAFLVVFLFAGPSGAIWGLWHPPAFFLSGTVFAGWNFLPFLVGNITLAILVTPLFNCTCGSLLWPMLFHWQLINPFWPDAQPYDTWLLVVVAMAVVWWNRGTMFTRHGAVTRAIPGERS